MWDHMLLVCWVGVLAGCGVYVWRLRQERGRLARAGAKCSLSYAARDRFDLVRRYSSLCLFQQGHDRFSRDVLIGPSPLGPVKILSYGYDQGFGGDRRRVRWVVGVLETDRTYPAVVVGGAAGDLAQWPCAWAEEELEAGGHRLRWPRPVPAETTEVLGRWVSAGKERYQVELSGRYAAIYFQQNGFADEVGRVFDDLQSLGRELEGTLPA